MILIFSYDSEESTTDEVIDWLDYVGEDFIRLNGIEFYKDCEINLSNIGMKVELKGISWDQVDVIWLRRWMSSENSNKLFLEIDRHNINFFKFQINEFLREENRAFLDFFFYTLPSDKLFSSLRTKEINKLEVLSFALKIGLLIPNTYIISNKNRLEKELHSNNLISKAIGNSAMIRDGNQLLVSYTNSIDKEDLKYIGEKFSPSLFQNKIAKKYEVRAFYIEGAIYSMAIFSQRDSQTRIDFRRYNYSNPNRVTCFKLPKNVEDKLIRVAQQFQLNAASFDLIKTLDGDYVFLEVNPGGQFEMTSKPCNYFLEKIVAEQLAQYSS